MLRSRDYTDVEGFARDIFPRNAFAEAARAVGQPYANDQILRVRSDMRGVFYSLAQGDANVMDRNTLNAHAVFPGLKLRSLGAQPLAPGPVGVNALVTETEPHERNQNGAGERQQPDHAATHSCANQHIPSDRLRLTR